MKAGGLRGRGGLAWTRDTWVPVVMQSTQPERGPHAAHRAVDVHGVRGCDRPSVLERPQGEASEPLAALYRHGDGGPGPQWGRRVPLSGFGLHSGGSRWAAFPELCPRPQG